MDLRLLGPLEVRLEDGPVELGPRKQRAVLAMLALEAGRTVSADRLAEGLWGEAPPSSAPKMVQLYVSHLRRVLDGDGGADRDARPRLRAAARRTESVDAVRFERLLDESRPREALALWRGEPLADLADEPFAAAEIRRLEELRLRATELAIDADLAAGRHAEVIGELDALVAEHPLRERLHAQRMLALYRSGRQAEALEAYRDARADARRARSASSRAPSCAPCTRRSSRRIRRSTCPRRPSREPARRHAGAPRACWSGAAVLLLAGVTAFGVIRVLEPDGLPGIDENDVGLIDPDERRITKEIPVGNSPARRRTAAARCGSPTRPTAPSRASTGARRGREDRGRRRARRRSRSAAGSLWVADSECARGRAGRSRREQGRAADQVGNAPRALAVAEGALWVASGVDGRVRRIDLDRGRGRADPGRREARARSRPAPARCGWRARRRARSRASTRAAAASCRRSRSATAPSALAVGEGAVWVGQPPRTGPLARIDPERNAVTWTAAVGRDPTAVAVGEGAVWVAGGDDGTVVHVDPDGPRVVEPAEDREQPVGDRRGRRIGVGRRRRAAGRAPGRHAAGARPAARPGRRPDATGCTRRPPGWATLQLGRWPTTASSRTGASTVPRGRRSSARWPPTRRRRAATASAYVFTLRRGLRYLRREAGPSGRLPGLDGALPAGHARPPRGRAVPEAVRGRRWCAGRCMAARGVRCDLVTWDRSGRADAHHHGPSDPIPDAEFLHKLTIPLASVVPADSPARATAGRTPARHRAVPRRRLGCAGEVGAFERNPHFLFGTGPLPRGQGFADRIEVRPPRLPRR